MDPPLNLQLHYTCINERIEGINVKALGVPANEGGEWGNKLA